MIIKPSWLRIWLDRLNWDIFTWRIYVGDAIESAVDWVIDRLNDFSELVNEALTWGKAAWESAGLFWTNISDWWAATRSTVLDWVGMARQYAAELFDEAGRRLAMLESSWDSFRTATLPDLVNKALLRDTMDAELRPLREETERHRSWLDVLRNFIDDPEAYLLGAIERLIERFW